MVLSAIGALVSGLILVRHTWRALMLVGCIALFEWMLSILIIRIGLTLGFEGKILGIASAMILFWLSFRIKKTKD